MSSAVVHNSFPLDHDVHDDSKDQMPNGPFMKGPKRKRLAKACDACHKSKRRCDGTAPCSNCYYASKTCTYTDSSGRPVPAPRPFKPDPQSSTSDHTASHRQPPYTPSSSSSLAAGPSQPHFTHPPSSSHPHHDEHNQPRKRFRTTEMGNNVPTDDGPVDGPIGGVTMDRPAPVELDHALTRELTNLFFTHCHPARAIMHKPTFTAALSHNRVPTYLLHAVCALAAPLSKQPRIRTNPPRFAGKQFAQEALSLMFDGAGRLVCKKDLATAQALCLLQVHDILTKDKNMIWNSRYHDLALHIVETLGVHAPEHPTLTPMPSPEFISASIEREAVRRIFWLIHLMDITASIYFKKPISIRENELRLRLPADETSFELGVHSTLPEYLYLPAIRTQYASEFGHLIRVISIYAKVEYALDELNDPETSMNVVASLNESEKQLETWAASLSEHLRFSESSLSVQQSMFETSSNTGAWCYCCMHVYHASCALALSVARQRLNRTPHTLPAWAVARLDMILTMLGDRAKNSILMSSALWALLRYCRRDDEKLRQWCSEYEEAWGTRMVDIARDWRSSPPLPPHHLSNSQHSQSISPTAHRRPSNAFAHPPIPRSQRDDVQYSSHRKASASPPAYPLGNSLGRPEDVRLHNVNPQPHGNNTNANSNGSGNSNLRHPNPASLGSQHIPDRDRDRGEARTLPNAASGTRPGSLAHSGDTYTDRERDSRRLDRELDHHSQNTNVGNGSSIQSQHQTLPSLKASGLLDSWGSSRVPLGDNSVQKQPHQLPPSHQPQQRSPRRTPPLSYSSSHGSDLTRPVTLPVGMPWLANETR
ncbi:hypothetical protein BDN72DRAFT_764612 [Pluteus cervinus]|uniref:Uncharacterized protein n=1 Tax=Pluteus cervinus TaxID=181527 RepID=A0ACD3B1I3_9AGAR|nr:hypothetical protein BDN72DRAFT_764612 [Pluteus cervinus]